MSALRPWAVIGGGWAGLAAAITLTAAGRPVVLFESAATVGGRARSLSRSTLADPTATRASDRIDNGQHLLLGAYRQTLQLLNTIGVVESDVLQRLPLQLTLYGTPDTAVTTDMRAPGSMTTRLLRLRAPRWLPAPLHLLTALLRCEGLNAAQRHAALRLALALTGDRQHVPDQSVDAWLTALQQPTHLNERLWRPLCLAALNTPAASASATTFQRVLRDSFLRRRHDSDLLIPTRPLAQLLPEPATTWLTRHGSELRCRQRVNALHLDPTGQRLEAISVAGARYPVAAAILATPPHISARLLQPHPPLRPISHAVAQLGSQPITTVWLRVPDRWQLSEPMIGFSDGLVQWLFDHRHLGRPGLFAAVISAHGEHDRLNSHALGQAVANEIQQRFQWPPPLALQTIRERRATFDCRVDSSALRPPSATPVAALALAGDWCATGYPATLEGAVRSGVQCANYLLQQIENP